MTFYTTSTDKTDSLSATLVFNNITKIIILSFLSGSMLFFNLFKLYIRPILEYNVSAWMLYQAGDVRKIESVQTTFTRLVCRKLNTKYESYKHCLSFFNVDTLEELDTTLF